MKYLIGYSIVRISFFNPKSIKLTAAKASTPAMEINR
jgi:hypothetical protein